MLFRRIACSRKGYLAVRAGRPRQSDHFSERIEPEPVFFDTKSTARADFDKKVESFGEQNRVVAVPSQFETSFARAFAPKQPN
jgi:thiamine pyrophosphate-dependent acetolactate synthase large subunit-like protein